MPCIRLPPEETAQRCGLLVDLEEGDHPLDPVRLGILASIFSFLTLRQLHGTMRNLYNSLKLIAMLIIFCLVLVFIAIARFSQESGDNGSKEQLQRVRPVQQIIPYMNTTHIDMR